MRRSFVLIALAGIMAVALAAIFLMPAQSSGQIWLLCGTAGIILLVVTLVSRFLVLSSHQERLTLGFGSGGFRVYAILGLILLIAAISALGWIAIEHNKDKILSEVRSNLVDVLTTTSERLNIWVEQRIFFTRQLGEDPQLVALAEQLLSVSPYKNSLLASDTLTGIRDFFDAQEDFFADIGFFIINPDRISIAATRDLTVGSLNVIALHKPELLDRVFNGETVFVPPITSDIMLGKKGGELTGLPPTMFFAGPVRKGDGTIIAAVAKRVDPGSGFSRIFQFSQVGETGETYAFDPTGRLLSESRFVAELRNLSLIRDDASSVLNIEIRDPGGNMVEGFRPRGPRSDQPYTQMAARAFQLDSEEQKRQAVQGRSVIETDMTGYRDYRGVPVFGAWLWDFKLGMGITTEIDVAEALSTYHTMRLTVIGILGVTLFLSVGATLFVLVLGERANKTLSMAMDNLEQEVADRTAALADAEERSRLLLESAGEGIFGVGQDGLVNFINPAGLDMLGYEPEEIIGHEIHSLIHHSRVEGRPYPLEDCPMHRSLLQGSMSHLDNEVLWRKDGTSFPVEYTSVPVRKNDVVMGSVVLFRDISIRKQAEEELKKLSSVVEQSQVSVIITDPHGIIEYVNPKFCEVSGYGFNEAIGKTPSILNAGIQSVEFYQELWGTILAGRNWQGEFANRRKNGDIYWENTTISPLRIEGDKITHFVAVKEDVTERKQAEEKLKRAYDIIEAQKERMQDELTVGRNIQMSMVPQTFPPFPKRHEFSIYADLIPAREVGGDFYDFFFIDENRLCLCIGDVSGKGVPAALFMAVTRTLIKARASDDISTASILTRVNDELSRDNHAYMFATIFLGVLHIRTGELSYTNAGHNPPFILRHNRVIERLDSLHGPVIGARQGLAYKTDSTSIYKDDILFMYTDGVTEARNHNKEFFQERRLMAMAAARRFESAQEMVEMVVAAVKQFEAGADQFDDITLMAIQMLKQPQSKNVPSMEMTLNNRFSEIERLKGQFNSFSNDNHISVKTRRELNVVFDELLNNIISYAYEDDNNHKIEVRVELTQDRLIVFIEDDGIPFNPLDADPPDTGLALEERSLGGLGIHLVRNVMDKFTYHRSTGKNRLTLVKDVASVDALD